MEPKIYPLWKEALKHVLLCAENNKEPIVTFEDLEVLLEAKKESPEFQFGVMALNESLLTEHGIWMMRCRGIGYKVATDREKAREGYERYQRQAIRKLAKQSLVLQTVNPEKLDEDERDMWERKLTKNALVLSFNNQLPLDKVQPGMAIKADRVRLIDILSRSEEYGSEG